MKIMDYQKMKNGDFLNVEIERLEDQIKILQSNVKYFKNEAKKWKLSFFALLLWIGFLFSLWIFFRT